MIIKIRITTPKGQATKAQRNLRPFLIGSKKAIMNTYINDDDSELYWEIDTHIRKAIAITKRVGMYKNMIHTVLSNRQVTKRIESKEQKKELENMLKNQTKIEIIREATANEMVEANQTLWQRVTSKFKKNQLE